jgi:GMP synthase-like glutamine amidotransferase
LEEPDLRSLIVRFLDCEGPGSLEHVLRDKGIKITYHDSYRKGLQLVPEAHQVFDLIVLMGGPQTVHDPAQSEFFKPYLQLVEDTLSVGHKVVGICLGSQIISRALGGVVSKGDKGPEVGFGKVSVKKTNHELFKGITSSEIPTFHLHEDTFTLPPGAELLLSSDKYENQMFVYDKKAFAIQCHFEVTSSMLPVWWKIHKILPEKLGALPSDLFKKTDELKEVSKLLFENILSY